MTEPQFGEIGSVFAKPSGIGLRNIKPTFFMFILVLAFNGLSC